MDGWREGEGGRGIEVECVINEGFIDNTAMHCSKGDVDVVHHGK